MFQVTREGYMNLPGASPANSRTLRPVKGGGPTIVFGEGARLFVAPLGRRHCFSDDET